MKHNYRLFGLALSCVSLLVFTSCGDDDEDTPSITVPSSYSFERNGASTVDFSGPLG